MNLLDKLLGPRREGLATMGGSWPVSQTPGVLFARGQSAAGVSVNEDSAMSLSGVFAAVNQLSRIESTLPLGVYRRTRKDGRPARADAGSHPAAPLLATEFNPEMTASVGRRVMAVHRLLGGNAYAEIAWKGNGHPAALWPVEHWRVRPDRDERGELYYLVDGKRRVAAADMIHVPHVTYDGVCGRSFIEYAYTSLGLGIATQEHAAAFFGNGAMPGGMLKHPGQPTEQARAEMRRSWQEQHRGPRKAGSVAVVWGGWDFDGGTASISPDKAQLMEARRFTTEEVARWLNVPPHVIRDLSRATNNNIEQQGIDFVVYSIGPTLIETEQEYDRKLLNAPNLCCKHDLNALMRGDSAQRSAFYSAMVNMGAFSVNDVLEAEDRNPIGPDGDVHFVPLNMVPIARAVNPPEPPAAPPAPPAEPGKSGPGGVGTPAAGPAPPKRAAGLSSPESERLYGEDQPRTADGEFGSGEEGKGDKSAAARAHSALAKIGGATKKALVKAGASVMHVEHAAKEWITEKAGAAVARLPERWQSVARGAWRATRIGASVAFATHLAGQVAAEAVAKERGLSSEAAKALRGVLGAIDTAATKPIALGLELTGMGHLAFPASLVPVASTAYLAYSTARHPLATIRAARKGIRAVSDKLYQKLSAAGVGVETAGPIEDIADRLKARTGEDLDWYAALLAAALDETGDVAAAVKLVDAAAEEMPEQGDAPEGGEDPFFDELDGPAGLGGNGGPDRFFLFSPDQQRDDHGRFGSGSGGREEHERKAKEKFKGDLRKNTTVTPNEKRQSYYNAAKSVYARMPEKALERMNANTNGHSFYNDTQELTDSILKDDPRVKSMIGEGKIGGSYDRGKRQLEIDGKARIDGVEKDTNHTYAHEFSHAIDGPKKEISGTTDWKEAFDSEIKSGRLTRYAATSPSEGFAEFGRLLYASDKTRAQIEKAFPKCAKVWKEHELW